MTTGIYPTCFLLNTKTKRWHPISFRYAPLPGSYDDRTVDRYKSVGHHTCGFLTIEEAVDFIKSEPEMRLLGSFYAWDGEETPAMSLYLPIKFPDEDMEKLAADIIVAAHELESKYIN